MQDYAIGLAVYSGNKMTNAERKFHLRWLRHSINEGDIDKEMLPFLRQINAFPFIATTQSCCGHGDGKSHGDRQAHITFRCALSPEETIDSILSQLDPLPECRLNVQISFDCDQLSYTIWIHQSSDWREVMEDFIHILEKVRLKEA